MVVYDNLVPLHLTILPTLLRTKVKSMITGKASGEHLCQIKKSKTLLRNQLPLISCDIDLADPGGFRAVFKFGAVRFIL